MAYIYLNERAKHDTSQGFQSICEIKVNRQDVILSNPTNYKMSVERFYLHGIRLPLFDPSKVCQIGVRNTGSGEIKMIAANFTPYKESDGYLYDYGDVALAVNQALLDACAYFGTDAATFDFDDKTLRFSITSTAAFKIGYEVVMDQQTMYYFSSFNFKKIDDDHYAVKLFLDTEIQDSGSIEFLSPVHSIVIESDNLPVVAELLPPYSNSTSISTNAGVFLTDYKYYQSNNQSMITVDFQASNTDHRWHSLTHTQSFTAFNLRWVWYDYDGNKKYIYLTKPAECGIKILFQRLDA